ncbi:MAG: glycosyl transferase family 2 [Flavobacteriaceae bacterium]|nr:glycosyl transferase family 2 [Flavobacteriaceae bacterium]
MLSIIIPVLNEVESLPLLLTHLGGSASAPSSIEVIVVDGGSTDGTASCVANFKSRSPFKRLVCISSEKGRPKQMNVGAAHAKGEVLYFLHADSFPPKQFDAHILSEVRKGNPAGCFRMQFDSTHWWLRLAGWLTQFNWRACRGGDQSQFISRELFDEVGGYDEDFAIYEDNVLINQLYARNRFTVINRPLTTSARLYRERGIAHVQFHFWTIYLKRWLGADAEALAAYYKKHLGGPSKGAPLHESIVAEAVSER